jgi:hypothetical protein
MPIAGFNGLGPRVVTAGGFKLRAGAPSPVGFSTATIGPGVTFASDTYLTGSRIKFPLGRRPIAGAGYFCRFDMVKTAASTATPIINVRFGTAGTVADTARLVFTFGVGTAVVDSGIFEIWAHWRSVGATSVLVGVCRVTHALAATGLTTTGASGIGQLSVVSGAFSSIVDDSFIGVSFNGGTAFDGTCSLVESEMRNPLG